MRWPLSVRIGIGSLFAGALPLALVFFLYRQHDWQPLRVPLGLVPGEFKSSSFKTDLNGRYLANLTLDERRGSARNKEDCMLGIPLPPSVLDCSGISRSVDFDWQIVEADGRIIGRGSYAPTGFSGTEVNFAEFQAKSGDVQRILLEVKKNAEELNTLHPILSVQAGPEYREAFPYWYYYAWLWAKVAWIVGLLVIVIPVCFKR